MITKEELRVGNAVQHGIDNKRYRVNEIYEYAIELNSIKHGKEFVEVNDNSLISGIPITDKLLEKLGFTEQGHVNEDQDDIYYWHHADVDWILDQGYQPIDAGFAMIKYELLYIHQLQNLYFALTGKELIFEL